MRQAGMRLASVLALTVAVLAGCSQPAPQPFGVPAAPTSAPPAGQTPDQVEIELYGPRVELPGGLLQKQLGKVAQISAVGSDDPRDWSMRIVLDSVEVDPRGCVAGPRAERGHRLLLNLRVETSAKYDPTLAGNPVFYEWSTIGPDGVSEAAASTEPTCQFSKSLPFELRPSAKYRGQVSVDTANPAGQLVLSNLFVWDYQG